MLFPFTLPGHLVTLSSHLQVDTPTSIHLGSIHTHPRCSHSLTLLYPSIYHCIAVAWLLFYPPLGRKSTVGRDHVLFPDAPQGLAAAVNESIQYSKYLLYE